MQRKKTKWKKKLSFITYYIYWTSTRISQYDDSESTVVYNLKFFSNWNIRVNRIKECKKRQWNWKLKMENPAKIPYIASHRRTKKKKNKKIKVKCIHVIFYKRFTYWTDDTTTIWIYHIILSIAIIQMAQNKKLTILMMKEEEEKKTHSKQLN